MNNSCLILLAHGSKNPEWAAPFRQLTADLRKELGNDAVYLCFLENAEPGMNEVAGEIMQTSVRQGRVLPMFMAKGAHFNEDMPALIAEIEALHPGLKLELLEPIGLHPLFIELMRTVLKSL